MPVEPLHNLEPNTVHQFVLGLDDHPQPMNFRVLTDLRDPFADHILTKGNFPLSLRALLAAIDAIDDDLASLPKQQSFLIADGGQIHWSPETASVARHFRLTISRTSSSQPGILISTSTQFDSESQFLQVLAWDSNNEVYNYYERRGGTWLWAGNSYHALTSPTRGKGPFDSHVNGSLVMKELKFPWAHWHSEASAITDEVLEPDDPLRAESLWRDRLGADVFEDSVVRPGIERWTKSRIHKCISDRTNGALDGVIELMRQVLETTTVNLIASERQSRSIRNDTRLRLPITFFLNSDALFNTLELEPNISVPEVIGEFYLQSLSTYGFHLRQEDFRLPGDTHFAFLVPEPAFEDLSVLNHLIREEIIGKRFAACLLMIDFVNPISSASRAHLMRYVPRVSSFSDGNCDLEDIFVRNIEQTIANVNPASSIEAEFLNNWNLGSLWKRQFEERIETYFLRVFEQLQSQEGFNQYVELGESRRREFRKRPLAEFDLTLPVTNIPDDSPTLQMRQDGTVGPKQGVF